MGVVSNGMLCSGDELGLTADADGILILPADTPLGAAAGRPVRRRRPRRRRQAEPRRRAVDRRARPRGRGGDRRAAPLPADRRRRDGPADGRALCGRGPRPRPVPAVRRPLGRAASTSARRPTAIQMRLLAAGHAARSATSSTPRNYVMVELGKPIHTFDAAAVHDGRIIVRRATAGRAARDARPRRARARPGHAGHRRPGAARSASPASWAAPSSEVGEATTDVIVESAIFDPVSIRRTAFRYALRSEASLRFEKGQECRLARLGADRTARLIAEWAGGQVAPGRGRHRTRSSRRRRASRSGRRASTGCSGTDARTRRAARAPRAGRDRDRPAARRRRRSAVAAGAEAARGRRRRRRGRSTRPSRPGAATSRSRPTSPRRSSASAATSSSRRRLPAHADAALPARPARASATRVRETLAGAGLTEVVTLRPRRAEDGRAVPGPRRRRARRRAGAARRPAGRSSSPTRCRASTRSCARACIGSLLEVVVDEPAPRPRRRRDLRGRQGLRRARTSAPTHEWWRLGFALTGAAEPPAWDRPARPYDLDDAKGVVELLVPPPRLRRRRPTTPLTDDPNLHPGRAARVAAGGALVGRVGELHPARRRRRSTCAPSGSSSPRSRSPGLAGGQPTPYRVDGAVAASRGRARPGGHRRRVERPAAEVEAAIRRHGGPLLRDVDAVRHLPRPAARRRREEPGLPADAARRRADADRRPSSTRPSRPSSAGLAADVGARFRT